MTHRRGRVFAVRRTTASPRPAIGAALTALDRAASGLNPALNPAPAHAP
ncbi:hypothetical protein ABT369_07525 [Dactylosporangium sp. NPDC000244]